MPTFEALTGLVTAGCAVAAVVTAHRGLATWRHQLYGTTEYEQARRLYRALLEIRDQVSSARVPFIPAAETDAAFNAVGIVPNHDGFHRDDRSTEVIYAFRWGRVQRAFSDFEVELLNAEVLWGQSIRAPEKALKDCLSELRWSFDKFIDEMRDPSPRTLATRARLEENGKVMHRQSENDAFAARVEESVRKYEHLLRPHLRRTK